MAKGNTGWFPHPPIGWFEPLLYELQFRIGVVMQKLRKARDLRSCIWKMYTPNKIVLSEKNQHEESDANDILNLMTKSSLQIFAVCPGDSGKKKSGGYKLLCMCRSLNLHRTTGS